MSTSVYITVNSFAAASALHPLTSASFVHKRHQSTTTDSDGPLWKTPRTMPLETYQYMSNVWKDGIFGTAIDLISTIHSSSIVPKSKLFSTPQHPRCLSPLTLADRAYSYR